MKRVTITDRRGIYPTYDQIVEDDANPYMLIDEHVVANGGKPYKVGMSMSAYYGRFWVVQKTITE
ncbi:MULTISPECIES: hypothetical protein [unclassified Caballeronia]|jgi:hypothetical protein|uniref:hypothetical protein n=1 Tax=unclassified Caballeronia TaxID=2646786 RepID=UPI00202811FA|nr:MULTISPECIES: hypothetical protein [unclassified Caballeronia]